MLKLPWQRKKEEKRELFNAEVKAKRIEGLETLKASRLASLVIEKCGRIFSETGAREAGSPQAARCAGLLLESFGQVSDSAALEEEKANCSSFWMVYSVLPVAALAMLVFCWTGFPSLALVLCILTCLFIWHSFLLCSGRDRGLLSRDIVNVSASIEPEEAVQDTVIFTSHHDSAPMFTRQGQSPVMALYLPTVHFILLSVVSLCLFISEIITGQLFRFNLPPLAILILLVLLTLSLPVYARMFSLVGKECSPGVGDNLVSCAILTELAHYFWWKKGNGEGLAHTRLVFASFDGEECGLKGSRAWYRRHRDELVNAVNINLDCPLRSFDFTFLTKDVNGFVPLSSRLASECAQSAASMGYDVKVGALSVLSGATDAASAARCGIEATTLMGIPLSGAGSGVIHTDADNLSVLDKASIEEAISICIKIVEGRARDDAGQEKAGLPSLADEKRKFTLR